MPQASLCFQAVPQAQLRSDMYKFSKMASLDQPEAGFRLS